MHLAFYKQKPALKTRQTLKKASQNPPLFQKKRGLFVAPIFYPQYKTKIDKYVIYGYNYFIYIVYLCNIVSLITT